MYSVILIHIALLSLEGWLCIGRYILKINIGSVPLLFPCQCQSSIFGPGRAVNGLINNQSRALGGRYLDCVGVCW